MKNNHIFACNTAQVVVRGVYWFFMNEFVCMKMSCMVHRKKSSCYVSYSYSQA